MFDTDLRLLLLLFSYAEAEGCGNWDGLGAHIQLQCLNVFNEKKIKKTQQPEHRGFLTKVMSKVTFKFK